MSDIKFDTLATHLEWRAAINVSGVDPLPVQYSDRQMFVPDRLLVSYYRSNNEPWILINITVTGRRLTATGGLSKTRGKYVWTFGETSSQPEWLKNQLAWMQPPVLDSDQQSGLD